MVFYKSHSHFQYRNSILLVKDIFHTGREGSAPRWLSSNVEYINCCRYSAGVILQPMFLTNGQWIRYSGDFPRSQLKTVSILVSGVHPWHAFQIICSYSRTQCWIKIARIRHLTDRFARDVLPCSAWWALIAISPSDSASHWSFAYYNGIVGNTSVADGALILHMIT